MTPTRRPDGHLPVVVGIRHGHEQQDGAAVIGALRRAGFEARPIGTIAVTSLAVIRLRTAALSFEGLEREELVDLADNLERKLTTMKEAGIQ